MINSVMKSTTTMNTKIKGQEGYAQDFYEKHEKEIKKSREFFWIYKG